MDEIDLEDEVLTGEDDFWDSVADDSSTTELLSISSEYNYLGDFPSNSSTSTEAPLEDVDMLDGNSAPFDAHRGLFSPDRWKMQWPTMLMEWALHQAHLRALEHKHPDFIYTHLPLPDISHLIADVKALDPNMTPRLVPRAPGGPRKQLIFCSATPPATGASIYSKPSPVPFHGPWKQTKRINFSTYLSHAS